MRNRFVWHGDATKARVQGGESFTPFSPALAQDMQFITLDERSAQIRERQVYQKQKYAPW